MAFGLKYATQLPIIIRKELEQFVLSLRATLANSLDEDGNLRAQVTATVSSIGFPIGAMVDYGGVIAPAGWLICDGSAVSRATYNALFLTVGTTYGAGDGVTTFNIPDRRGRFGIGKAVSGTGSTLGATGGLIDHVHSGPSHTHSVAQQAFGVTGAPSVNVTSVPSATTAVQSGAGTTVATGTHTHDLGNHTHSVPAHDHGAVTGAAGAGNTGVANPPYLASNVIILVQ